MSNRPKTESKVVKVADAVVAKAKADPVGYFSSVFLSSFGFNVTDAAGVAVRLIDAKAWKVCMLCIAAAVAVRGQITILGDDVTNLSTVAPELVIDSDREQKDMLNFKAAHLVGHVLLNMTAGHEYSVRAFSKVGNAVTGNPAVETVAGKINSELAKAVTAEQRAKVSDLMMSPQAKYVKALLDKVSEKAAAFGSSRHASTAVVVASAPATVPKTKTPAKVAVLAESRPPAPLVVEADEGDTLEEEEGGDVDVEVY